MKNCNMRMKENRVTATTTTYEMNEMTKMKCSLLSIYTLFTGHMCKTQHRVLFLFIYFQNEYL